MIKLIITAVVMFLMSWQVTLAEETANNNYPETAVQMRFMKSGEWPLPRIAPFLTTDIVGQWIIQPHNTEVIDVRYVGTDNHNRDHVDIRLYDRQSGMLIGRGPALVTKNILRSYNLNYKNQPFYFEMVSLIPPKNSKEAKNNEKMIYAYFESRNDENLADTLSIKKIQPPVKKGQKK